MPTANEHWTILPHSAIEPIADNLWRVQGELPNMPLKRVMTLARRADGSLVIHNGMALGAEPMAQIEAWGTPRHLVVPNGWHRLDAPAYRRRYSELSVWCPRGARKHVQQVVRVDGCYEDFPADETVRFEPLGGVRETEGVMVVRSADGTTLVFNDLIFNMPHQGGLGGLFFRYVNRASGGPRITRIGRLAIIKDKRAFRDSLERLAALDGLVRIIVSHYQMITDDPAGVLRSLAASL